MLVCVMGIVVGGEMVGCSVVPRPVPDAQCSLSPGCVGVVFGFGDTGKSEPLASQPAEVEPALINDIVPAEIEGEGVLLNIGKVVKGGADFVELLGLTIVDVCIRERLLIDG